MIIKGAGSVNSDHYVSDCMLSSQNGVTPLSTASLNGHIQVAELLLSKGADVNLPDQVQCVSKCNTCYRKSDH